MQIAMPKTVGELIELLSAFQPTLPVMMQNHHYDRQEISCIKVEKVNKTVNIILVENYRV